MAKWCFLKILIRKNKQLFTIALSYGTSSVTVKNGQYLDQPAGPEQVAHVLTAKIHAQLLTVKNHTHYFQYNSRDGTKNYLLCGKQVTNPVLNTEVQTSKSETIWMNLVSLRLRSDQLLSKSNAKLNNILTNGFWSTKAPECMDCLSNISAWYFEQHPASYIQKIQCWLHTFSVTRNQ